MKPDRNWHARDVSEVLDALGTDVETGLTAQEVAVRRRQFGDNRLPEKGADPWYLVLVRQFTDPLVAILAVAALLSASVGEWSDTLTILAILLLNGILGFVQEWRSEQALAALGRLLTPKSRVVRDGTVHEIEATELVPGDVVLVDTGDRIPADLRLIDIVGLEVDESALTGESVPVAKQTDPVHETTPVAERASMAWMGTVVTNGSGRGVVVATGMETVLGRVAGLTATIERTTTPLQRRLARLSRQLGAIAMGIVLLIGLAGWLHHHSLVEVGLTAISLAVAVVPEGLPAVVTLTLALGVRALIRRRVLLRRLRAAEALGAVTTICMDKTGTLTVNQMTVRLVVLPDGRQIEVSGSGYEPRGEFFADGVPVPDEDSDLDLLLYAGRSCNHARLVHDDGHWQVIGDPTEGALIVAAEKRHVRGPEGKLVGELSFSSERMRMSVLEQRRDGVQLWLKGAPEVVLERCVNRRVGGETQPFGPAEREALLTELDRLAGRGYRLLALATRRLDGPPPRLDAEMLEQQLTLLGVVAMVDPPRPEVPAAVAAACQAGIRIVMITGDAAPTAVAIADNIGLVSQKVLSGNRIAATPDDELASILSDGNVIFARAAPDDKIRIVRLLQARGAVVAMTGDGVNDAPALKQADVGVAMGCRGTDVARQAADIVLLDDNFASIVAGIEEGRRQGDNIGKFIQYLLSSNLAEVVAIGSNMFLGGPVLLLPVQILWMNLVTDGATALALGMEPAEPDTMARPPRSPDRAILHRRAIGRIAAIGVWMGLVVLTLFSLRQQSESLDQARTMAFTGLVLLEKFNVFNFRSFRSTLPQIGLLSNPWLLLAWGVTVSLQVAAVYVPFLQTTLHTVPLSVADWGWLGTAALPVVIVPQLIRSVRLRRGKIID